LRDTCKTHWRDRPIGRSRPKWENNRMEIKEVKSELVRWIHVAQDSDQW